MRELRRSVSPWTRGVELASVRLPPTPGQGGGVVAGKPANKQLEVNQRRQTRVVVQPLTEGTRQVQFLTHAPTKASAAQLMS